MVNKYIPDRGDLIWLNFSPQAGHEQCGTRPALVLSSKIYNRFGLLITCPITSKSKGYWNEVPIKTKEITGVVLADQVKNQDWQSRGAQKIGKASQVTLNKVQELISAIILQ